MDASDVEKSHFDSNLVVLWVTFGVFLECLGMFFSELFVCIGLYGPRVFEAVSYVFYDPFLQILTDCSATLSMLITHNGVMLPNCRLS